MPMNVVLITLDGVRPDYLGCYGKRNVKTPNIDLLASKGVLVEKVYSHTPCTSSSHLSLFTSRLPLNHGIRFNRQKFEKKLPVVSQIFQSAGYQTAAFVGAFVFDKQFGFNRGYDFYSDDMTNQYIEPFLFKIFNYQKDWGGYKVTKFSRNANRVSGSAIRWLKSIDNDKPFFTWLHYTDAHDVYRLPLPLHLYYYRRRNYQQNVEYIDKHLGKFAEYLKKENIFENTLFIITSDHGESLNDYQFKGRDYTGHSNIVYNVALNIPLIMAGPNIPVGKRSKQLFRQVDILPTLLNMVGISYESDSSFEGENLSDILLGKSTEKNLEVFAETLRPRAVNLPELRALIQDPWKYVLKGQGKGEVLYHLIDDPQERENIINRCPQIAEKMRSRLYEIIKNDNAESVLEALGYS